MKKCIITACIFIFVGAIVFVVALSMCGWDFEKLSTVKTETNIYETNEEFSNVSIKTYTADIVFLSSDDGKCKIVCYEEKKQRHSVEVQNGTLMIDVVNEKEWYDYIGINFGSPKITVYLPKTEYGELTIKESTGNIEIPNDFRFKGVDISVSTGDVKCYASAAGAIKIATSTGDICAEDISAGSLELSVSTGKTYLTDITCKNVISSGNTGDVFLKNVIATEKFYIERSTGDVKFDSSDASEIYVETDTGDVTGALLSEKVFIVETDTGNIDVPKTSTGGRCEIITDTGNIRINVQP